MIRRLCGLIIAVRYWLVDIRERCRQGLRFWVDGVGYFERGILQVSMKSGLIGTAVACVVCAVVLCIVFDDHIYAFLRKYVLFAVLMSPAFVFLGIYVAKEEAGSLVSALAWIWLIIFAFFLYTSLNTMFTVGFNQTSQNANEKSYVIVLYIEEFAGLMLLAIHIMKYHLQEKRLNEERLRIYDEAAFEDDDE